MASFVNPFVGNIPKIMTNHELAQALRVDIAAELEATFLYDAHAHATNDPLAKSVLEEIRDEEIAHIGELMTLLRYLDSNEAEMLMAGEGEVKEMMESLGLKADWELFSGKPKSKTDAAVKNDEIPSKKAPEASAKSPRRTVGSLLDK